MPCVEESRPRKTRPPPPPAPALLPAAAADEAMRRDRTRDSIRAALSLTLAHARNEIAVQHFFV
jgi:hypothetical protein